MSSFCLNTDPNWITAVATCITALAAIWAAYIYNKQASIMKAQKEIAQNQQDLLETIEYPKPVFLFLVENNLNQKEQYYSVDIWGWIQNNSKNEFIVHEIIIFCKEKDGQIEQQTHKFQFVKDDRSQPNSIQPVHRTLGVWKKFKRFSKISTEDIWFEVIYQDIKTNKPTKEKVEPYMLDNELVTVPSSKLPQA